MKRDLSSPLAKHAFNPTTIAPPLPQFDLAELVKPGPKTHGFETIAFSRGEDSKRAMRLCRSSLADAVLLGNALREAVESERMLLSPASSFYMRECRRNLLGNVLVNVNEATSPHETLLAFTLIHPLWKFSVGQLSAADPAAIKKQLRQKLVGAGVIGAHGIMFAGLHGRLKDGVYQLHYHGLASSEKAKLVCSMAGRFGFRPTDGIQHPIETSKINNLPGWLSYCLKSYWPLHREYLNKTGSKITKKVRLPRLQQEEVLVWMAQQHLLSLITHSGFASAPWGSVGKRSL